MDIRKQKKGRKVVPILLGMILGAALLCGIAFGFWYFVLSDRQSPEAILHMSIQKMAGIQSYSISGNTNLKTDSALSSWLPFLQSTASSPLDAIETPQSSPAKQTPPFATQQTPNLPGGESILTVTGDGAFDSRDSSHSKGFFSLHIQADSPADRIKAKFGIDARIDGETIYFRLNDVDFSNTSLALLSHFAARWIQGDLPTLTKQYASDNVAKRKGFSPQELGQLVSIFQQTKPFLVTALPETGEAGVPLYHMEIVPQEEGMKQFLLASLDVFKQNGFQEKDAIAIRKSLQDPSFLQAMAQFVKQSTIELWIGKTDFLVRKVFSRFNFGTGTSGEITLNISAYNQDVPVTLPSTSEPIEQIIQEFLASFAPAEQTVKP